MDVLQWVSCDTWTVPSMDLWGTGSADGGEIMRKTIINRVRQRRERRAYYRALDNASPSMSFTSCRAWLCARIRELDVTSTDARCCP